LFVPIDDGDDDDDDARNAVGGRNAKAAMGVMAATTPVENLMFYKKSQTLEKINATM
jgi:hypothetical protein